MMAIIVGLLDSNTLKDYFSLQSYWNVILKNTHYTLFQAAFAIFFVH